MDWIVNIGILIFLLWKTSEARRLRKKWGPQMDAAAQLSDIRWKVGQLSR